MDQERALVSPGRSQLVDRSGIASDPPPGARVVRYVLGVTGGGLLASAAAMLSLPTVAVLTTLVSFFGPPVVFLTRRTARFVRASAAAAAAFRLAKCPPHTSLDGVAEGQWVRVQGHVLPGPGFTSAGGRPQSVLASYVGTLGPLRGSGPAFRRWELHAVDFGLALDSGDRVRVRVDGARYLGRPAQVPRELFDRRPLAVRHTDRKGFEVATVYDEDVVVVGDEVEVLGFLRRELDPTAEPGLRGVRPTATLGARPPWAVLIRRRPRSSS
jgi:hypothetical protein